MRKETLIAVGVVTAVVASIAVWLMVSTGSGTEVVTPGANPEVIEIETTEILRSSGNLTDEAESDVLEELLDSGDVTRIIVVEPEGDEISDLLSEKVIQNGKIVDKQP